MKKTKADKVSILDLDIEIVEVKTQRERRDFLWQRMLHNHFVTGDIQVSDRKTPSLFS